MAKVRIYNIVPSHKRGNRGHSYGFAADMRTRIYNKEQRMVKSAVKEKFGSLDCSNFPRSKRVRFYNFQRKFRKDLYNKGYKFETVFRGKPYEVTLTPGEGFIIVQDRST